MVVALYLDYKSYYGITMHSNQYQNKLKDKHPITIYYAQHFKSNPLSMLKLVLVISFG
jgi:hypothetical protein